MTDTTNPSEREALAINLYETFRRVAHDERKGDQHGVMAVVDELLAAGWRRSAPHETRSEQ